MKKETKRFLAGSVALLSTSSGGMLTSLHKHQDSAKETTQAIGLS